MDYKEDLKNKLPELKKVEGFPIGNDEDILVLSDPPLYAACPNPYIAEFIEKNGKPYDEDTDIYKKEPYRGDFSSGRNDKMLNAHFYHTKVPPKAIQVCIEHYTNPGDIVFDGFCGTGTTGVATNRSGRYSILMDLSPIATFISANLNSKIEVDGIVSAVKAIENKVNVKINSLYKVLVSNKEKIINYTIWSDAFKCRHCGTPYFFFDKFVDFDNNKILEDVKCSYCDAFLENSNENKVFETTYDEITKSFISLPLQKPVLISYADGRSKKYKFPDNTDLELIQKINQQNYSCWAPSNPMMFIGENWGDLWRAGYHKGYSNTHHFYTKRNLIALSFIYEEIMKLSDFERPTLLFIFTSLYSRSHRMNRYIPKHGRHVGPLSGTLYISNLQVEINVLNTFTEKAKSIILALKEVKKNTAIISTQSVTATTKFIPENSIDYIYTDPPFGDNLPYSELNFIMEDWIKVHTNNKSEAIINSTQRKGVLEYNHLMNSAFKEYFKVLKPNRWMTVVFHNSQSKVWISIQDAITKAGFFISSVSVLDKKKGTTKQLSYNGAVKNDLVISAFKPKDSFTKQFIKNAGANLETEFVRMFLNNLSMSPSIERTEKMLYSKMLKFYLQHGYEINMDAKIFYKMLHTNFIEQDGFWFASDQLAGYLEYKKKLKLEGIDELILGSMFLFIADEKSALVWLYTFLSENRAFSDIHTAFTQLANIQGDNVPELRELLEQNFIFENDKYRRPKSEPEHIQISDKREKALLREFESLLIRVCLYTPPILLTTLRFLALKGDFSRTNP